MENEQNRRMAILQAALPYTTGMGHHAIELLLQTNALINTARGYSESDLESCDMEANPEEMLIHMQEFCTPKENDMIQMLLNFIKAGHLFRNYQEFMRNRQPNSGEDLSAAGYTPESSNPLGMFLQMFGGSGSSAPLNTMMEFLMTQLSPEQRQMFEQIKILTNASQQ